MYQIDFNKPEHIHFIGIGGISMSGLAEILLERGFTVSGSDAHESELTDKLTAHGAKIVYDSGRRTLPMISTLLYTQQLFTRITRSTQRQRRRTCRSSPEPSFSDSS